VSKPPKTWDEMIDQAEKLALLEPIVRV